MGRDGNNNLFFTGALRVFVPRADSQRAPFCLYYFRIGSAGQSHQEHLRPAVRLLCGRVGNMGFVIQLVH